MFAKSMTAAAVLALWAGVNGAPTLYVVYVL